MINRKVLEYMATYLTPVKPLDTSSCTRFDFDDFNIFIKLFIFYSNFINFCSFYVMCILFRLHFVRVGFSYLDRKCK